MHGYDVTDPSRLNEELGTPEDFEALVNELRSRGMGILLDIVPNHMAASLENPWWMDVLENGSASQYAGFFDVEWSPTTPTVREKIYLPDSRRAVCRGARKSEAALVDRPGRVPPSYYDTPFPLDPSTYHDIVAYHLSDLLGKLDASQPLLGELGKPPRNDGALACPHRRRMGIARIAAFRGAAREGETLGSLLAILRLPRLPGREHPLL